MLQGKRTTKDWLEGYLQYTENTEPSREYRQWVGISTIASALQRKCWLEWGTLTFFPNMYIILVGPPAARKGTAMKDGKGFLQGLGIPLAADETSRPKLVQTMQGAHAMAQTLTGDAVYHCSLTIFSTELTVFLGYDDKEMLSMLCKVYDCEDYDYATISRDTERVPNTWVNLLGATTPAQLQASVPEGFVGSGFTSRVVFVYQDNKGKTVIKPTLSDAQKTLEAALADDLKRIHDMCGVFVPTEDFGEVYAAWYQHAEDNPPFTDPRLEYYNQRRPTHIFKLSTILSASRGEDYRVTGEDVSRAIRILEETERYMPSVFAGLGANPLAALQYRLKKILREAGTLPMPEVARLFENDATKTQLGEAIAALEQMGICVLDYNGGKPRLVYKGRRA